MTTKLQAVLLAVLAVLPACTDRATSSGPSPEELKAEAEKLCADWLSWQTTCREDLDLESLEELFPNGSQEAFDICMDSYFTAQMEPCRVESSAKLKCEVADSCDNVNGLTETTQCGDELRVWSVCRQNPEKWAADSCSASECPGRCCGNAPGVDDEG